MSGAQSQGVAVPSAQQLRFKKSSPAASTSSSAVKRGAKSTGLLHDYYLRPASKPSWFPNFMTMFRIIILARFFSGMYSNLDDCDEVYNYWEPLHYLLKGYAFQTWEYSPLYAIRSYFYLLVNSLPGLVMNRYRDKRATFFLLRLALASVSSVLEALFLTSISVHISPNVARYALFALLASPAMWSASTAFLPSTFALFAVLLFSAASFSPVEATGWRRISFALTCLATGAVVGWPFVAVLALPTVLEHLLVPGAVPVPKGASALWTAKRTKSLAIAFGFASLTLIPVVLVDSQAYQKLVVVPYNIVSYNLFSSRTSPTLYGTEPPSYYVKSLLLSYNLFFPLALLSLPAVALTVRIDPKRFGDLRDRKEGATHPAVSLAIRLSHMYLWLAVLLLQSHKEERFLYPIYGAVAFNGSVTLYLIRGWLQVAYLKMTVSPWRTSQTAFFTHLTRSVILLSIALSLSRIRALHAYYHAPLNVYHHLQTYALPRLALERYPALYPSAVLNASLSGSHETFAKALDGMETQFSLEPLRDDNVVLCIGKEWHRFPGHFLVPDVVSVEFIRSEFDGLLPKKWAKGGEKVFLGRETSTVPTGMNDENRFEDDGRFVDPSSCTYLVDLDFPHRYLTASPSTIEPRYAVSKEWERAYCFPFLDNENSRWWSRILSVPGLEWLVLGGGQGGNRWGDYCLLKNKAA